MIAGHLVGVASISTIFDVKYHGKYQQHITWFIIYLPKHDSIIKLKQTLHDKAIKRQFESRFNNWHHGPELFSMLQFP